MNKAQLKGDLDQIEQGVNRSDMPEPMKRILRDVLEWNRGLVDQAASMNERTDAIEDAVDELLHGAEEGISTETFTVIMTALEQSSVLCYTVGEALKESPFDELTTKRFRELIRQCEQSLAVAKQTTQELVMPDEDGGGPTESEPVEAGEPEESEDEDDELDDEDDEGDEEVDNG